MVAPPNVSNYSIGKGKLWIADYVASPSAWTEIGNCPSVAVEHAVERLAHFSSMEGLKERDLNPVVSIAYTVTFETDEVCAENLNLWCLGTDNGDSIAALTNVDAYYSLKFVEDKEVGENRTFVFHKVQVAPNGAGALISEEWGTLSFTAEGLKDAANHPTEPFYTIKWTSTTTT